MQENNTEQTTANKFWTITATWGDNGRRIRREFVICAPDRNMAEVMAHNRLPVKYTTGPKPSPEDKVQMRIREIGTNPGATTMYSSDIIPRIGSLADNISSIEQWSILFGIAWGITIGQSEHANRPLLHVPDTSHMMNQMAAIQATLIKWAEEWLPLSADNSQWELWFSNKMKEYLGFREEETSVLPNDQPEDIHPDIQYHKAEQDTDDDCLNNETPEDGPDTKNPGEEPENETGAPEENGEDNTQSADAETGENTSPDESAPDTKTETNDEPNSSQETNSEPVPVSLPENEAEAENGTETEAETEEEPASDTANDDAPNNAADQSGRAEQSPNDNPKENAEEDGGNAPEDDANAENIGIDNADWSDLAHDKYTGLKQIIRAGASVTEINKALIGCHFRIGKLRFSPQCYLSNYTNTIRFICNGHVEESLSMTTKKISSMSYETFKSHMLTMLRKKTNPDIIKLLTQPLPDEEE